MASVASNKSSYYYELRIYFRHGNTIQINEAVDSQSGGQRYITDFTVRRGVDSPASLNFTVRDLGRNDSLYRDLRDIAIKQAGSEQAAEKQLFVDESSDVTWKQILESGNVVKLRVNNEYRGTFFVSSMRRSVNNRTTGYSVSCIGVQTWLMRQSLYFDVGGEAHYLKKHKKKKSKYLAAFEKYVTPDDIKASVRPDDAIKYIVNKLLKGFVTTVYGDYTFTDGSSVNDMFYLAVSPALYYTTDLGVIMQVATFFSGSDFSIWDAIYRYRSAPFHEIWVTTGGRNLMLFNASKSLDKGADDVKGLYKLHDEKEYIVFRPTPYDHPAIVNEEIADIEGETISIGTIRDVSLHSVAATFTGITIGKDAIIDSDLYQSDDNLYSVYKVSAGGAKITSGAADVLWPPITDHFALRQVGKRVFTSVMEGLDTGPAIKKKAGKKLADIIRYFRILQAKAWNWFKWNGRFNKGSITIQWLPEIYEGIHVRLRPGYPDENGIYYLNSYSLRMSDRSLTYTLEVTRGFPDDGFMKAAVDYVKKKTVDPKISDPSISSEPKKDIPKKEGDDTDKEDPAYSTIGGGDMKIDNKTGDIIDKESGETVGNIHKEFYKGAKVGTVSSSAPVAESEYLPEGKSLAITRFNQYLLKLPNGDQYPYKEYACLYVSYHMAFKYMGLTTAIGDFAVQCQNKSPVVMSNKFFIRSHAGMLQQAGLFSTYGTSKFVKVSASTWDTAKEQIDIDIPCIASLGGGHFMTIKGYNIVAGEKFFLIADPGAWNDTHIEVATWKSFRFGANKKREYSQKKDGSGPRKMTSMLTFLLR